MNYYKISNYYSSNFQNQTNANRQHYVDIPYLLMFMLMFLKVTLRYHVPVKLEVQPHLVTVHLIRDCKVVGVAVITQVTEGD